MVTLFSPMVSPRAYGFPAHDDHITLTPALALALSPTSRNYSLLWSVAPYAELQGEPWEPSLAVTRQEQNTAPPLLWSIASS